MTEEAPIPAPAELRAQALSLIEPDLDAVYMQPESEEVTELLKQASLLTPDDEVINGYDEARRAFNERQGDDPDVIPYWDNNRFIRAAASLSKGDVDILNKVVQAYLEKDYEYLVRLAAGWNYLAEKMSQVDSGVASQQDENGQQLQEMLSMMLAQNQGSAGDGGGAIGSPDMYAKLGDLMQDQAIDMVDNSLKYGANFGERDVKGKLNRKRRRQPVELHIPQGEGAGFNFAHKFSDSDAKYLMPEERRGLNRLLRKIQLWTFNIDTFTRVGVYQQLLQVLATPTENYGMDMPDMLGKLPRAIGAVMGFAHALHGGTEKAAGEIGGRAPSALDVESVERMMYRELVTKARDNKSGELRTVTTPLSTSRMRDVIIGNTAEQMTHTEPLFIHGRYNRGRPFTLKDLFLDPKLTAINRLQLLGSAQQTAGPTLDWKIAHQEVNDGSPVDIFEFIKPELDDDGNPSLESIQRIERLFQEARQQGTIDLGSNTFPIVAKKFGDGQVVYSLSQDFLSDDLTSLDPDEANRQRRDMAAHESVLVGDGVPLYIHPEINKGKPFVLHEVGASDRQKLNDGRVEMLVDGDLGPLYADYSGADEAARESFRHMFGEQWQTTENMVRLLSGKELLLDDVITQLEEELARNGLRLADVEYFEHEGADATEWNIHNSRVNDAYEEKRWEIGKGRELTVEEEIEAKTYRTIYMLGELVYVRYGMINNLAFDTAEVMQMSFQWDPAQLSDHLSELWIKAFGFAEYCEKYGIHPAVLRPVLNTFLKPLIGWKMKQVDAVMIAMSGDVAQSRWNDPIEPDKTEVIPQLFNLRDGMESALTKEQQQIIESILYDKSMHRTNIDRAHEVNYTNRILEELMKASASDRPKLEAALEERSQAFSANYYGRYAGQSSQIMPRSRNDAIALVNAMPEAQRKAISGINFKDLLKVMGYEHMELVDAEYIGWFGLSKLTAQRSSRHFLLGRLEDKLLKYEGKYPELATNAGAALGQLIVGINQAIDPQTLRYLGGKPRELGMFRADSAIEGLMTETVTLAFFYGKRTADEAEKYIIKDIFEPLQSAAKSLGYIDQVSWRASVKELIQWVIYRTAMEDEVVNYQMKGKGEHGSKRQRVEVSLTPPSIDDVELKNWARATLLGIRAQRRQGNRVVFPEGTALADFNRWANNHPKFNKELLKKPERETSLQRLMRLGKIRYEAKKLGHTKLAEPYVVVGNAPVYSYETSLVNGKVVPSTVKGTGLARYNHRGGDPLMLTVLVKVALDQQLIDRDDAHDLIEILKKDPRFAWWRKAFDKWAVGENVLEELESAGIKLGSYLEEAELADGSN